MSCKFTNAKTTEIFVRDQNIQTKQLEKQPLPGTLIFSLLNLAGGYRINDENSADLALTLVGRDIVEDGVEDGADLVALRVRSAVPARPTV